MSKDRVGSQEHIDWDDADISLKVVTWAQRVSFMPVSISEWHQPECIDLDRETVQDVVTQLQEWLDSFPEG